MNPNFLLLLPQVSIALEGSPWLLFTVCTLAFFFSYLIYKHTIPPVGRFIRILLFLLRALALLILIALLFHPILTLRHSYLQKPDVAVLIDNSRSIQIKDSNVARADLVHNILKHRMWKDLRKNISLHFIPFASTIDTTFSLESLDSLTFAGEGSDISRALEMSKSSLMDRYFSSVILISDGIYNMGENPEFLAGHYGVPIHAIGIGDPREKKDVVVSNVVTNEIVYAQNQIPVDVTITQSGFTGKKIQVLLKQQNRVIDQKILPLAGKDQELHVKLTYRARKPGFQKFRVEVPALDEEFTRRNNVRNFVVKVLKSKVKILLLAGEPSLDYKFLRRGLQRDENVELTSYVQQKGGGNYQRVRIQSLVREDFQLIIFLGFPRWPIPAALTNFLRGELLEKKKPLFFLQRPNLDLASLRPFADVLPFQLGPRPRNPREVGVDPTISGEESPVVRLMDDRAGNQKSWNDLPPVFTYMVNFAPYLDSEVLLQVQPALSKLPVSDTYRKPLLLARTLGEQKVLAFLAYGYWRWDLMMWGVGKSNQLFLTFLNRAVRWLITREETKPVRFSTDRLVYRSGDQVYMQAQVYTRDYRPIEDATVKMRLVSSAGSQEFHLEPLGNGKYQIQFRVFQGGEYTFSGEARREDQFFGADTGRFSVGEFDIEFQQTRLNEAMLRKVAQLSGGEYFTHENFPEIAKQLPAETRQLTRVEEFNLWNEWLALIAFLVLLSLEWTIRRRRGML